MVLESLALGSGVGVWEGHISSGLKKGPGDGVTLKGKDGHKQGDNMATADTNTT